VCVCVCVCVCVHVPNWQETVPALQPMSRQRLPAKRAGIRAASRRRRGSRMCVAEAGVVDGPL